MNATRCKSTISCGTARDNRNGPGGATNTNRSLTPESCEETRLP